VTVLILGGGYTGVELAAELADLPGRSARALRVGLLEAGSRLLPQSTTWLAKAAAASLERLGVQVFLDCPCLAVDRTGAHLAGGHIRADLVVQATGVRAPDLLRDSGLEVNGAGRALVDSALVAVGHPQVLVLGDAELIGAHIESALGPNLAHAGKNTRRVGATRLLVAQRE
jgi:NADH dehydrogenase